MNPYINEDLYNRDEFTVFKKRTLEKTLSIEQSVRDKYDKNCIIINTA